MSDGTSTESIAKRVGARVSQPYPFRLFPGKKAIFTHGTCVAEKP